MKQSLFLMLALWVGCGLTGCGTFVAQLYTSGGSRADAVVELSYNWDLLSYPGQTPELDLDAALYSAEEACQHWGYQGASPFQGVKKTCQMFNLYGGCIEYLFTYTYQCTGKGYEGLEERRRRRREILNRGRK
jgi:hypothetical protein